MSLNNNRRCTVPVIRDEEGALSGGCERAAIGVGVSGPSVPSITMRVQNPQSLIWTDEDLQPVQEENGDLILLDNV